MNNTSPRFARAFKWAIIGFGALLVALLIFDAGFALGARHAFERHGHEAHGGGPVFQLGGYGFSLPRGFTPGEHGAVGTIQSISLPTFTLSERDGDMQTVTITPTTVIKGATSTLMQSDLHAGQQVIVLGNPRTASSSESIQAVFIRIFPPLSQH